MRRSVYYYPKGATSFERRCWRAGQRMALRESSPKGLTEVEQQATNVIMFHCLLTALTFGLWTPVLILAVVMQGRKLSKESKKHGCKSKRK